MRTSHYSQGLSVVEIIVAAAIIVTVVTTATGSWQLYLRMASTGTQKSQAAMITEETAEVLHLFRDQNWTSLIAPLTLGTRYQLYWTGVTYTSTTTDIVVQNQFIRTFTLSSIYRDTNDNITSSGGTLDTNSRKVSISISTINATSTPIMQSEMLIHNVYKN